MEPDKTQSTQAKDTFDIFEWMTWLHTNFKTVVTVASAVAVVAIAISLYSWKKNQNERNAGDAFMAQQTAIVSGHADPTALFAIASEYSGTVSGRNAQLLGASALYSQGKFDQASIQFGKFIADNGSSPLVAQATYGIAACQESLGKLDDALIKYQDIISKYSGSGVLTSAKQAVARIYERQNKLDKAAKEYETLARSPMRGDPVAEEAMLRLDAIYTAHPELRPAPAPIPDATKAPAAITNAIAPAAPTAKPAAAPTAAAPATAPKAPTAPAAKK
jgi:predicted negative regulator of RcsB-dependent stress response